MAHRTWEQYEKYLIQRWPLTRREVRIAVECLKGRKNKEIAGILEISAETVNKHLDHIYRITGARGRDQFAAELLIADIDNTPLQQSLCLTGEGAALVGAGFVNALYTNRNKKRPRLLGAGSPASRKAPDRKTPDRSAAASSSAVQQPLAKLEKSAAVADAGSPTSRRWLIPDQIPPMNIEDGAWLPSADLSIATEAGES
jgi:DNA-binding CsgD family transcriptional regulator